MSIYDSLNKEQQKAVFQTQGQVLILAGAGSGKTRVITHRIAYLLDECNVNPWNILAITFTNKAAGEMRDRVDHLVGFGSESIWISTFHSMCVRILRRHIDLLGYDSAFTIYDTDDQKALMKQVCAKIGIDTKELRERTILSAISAAKNDLMTPLRYQETHTYDYQQKQIGEAYDEYQRALKKNNALDFDDLLIKTVELFQSHEEVLANYRDRFRYIMVDEYQDTNTVQFELVRLLSGKDGNLCVVGDDDQSIYGFRGANIRNILDFEKVYPDALVIKLEQNYRSTQNVLDAANAVIRNNTGRKDKSLWTEEGSGSKIHFREFATGMDEAAFIAEDIARKMEQDHKRRYSDFAVLYRTNAQSRLLEDRFVLHSIPYNIVGGTNFYARMEIRDILSYLRTVANGQDDMGVLRIINVPRRGIGQTSISRVQDYAMQKDIGLYQALEQADQIPSIGKALGRLREFTELIQALRQASEDCSVSDLIQKIVDMIGYEEYLRDNDDLTWEDRMSNIDELISKAAAYEEEAEADPESGTATLSGFLEEVALVADIDGVDDEEDKVLLMTLHSAKGLEFPHVYIAGLEENMFPSYMSLNSDDPDAIEEERRLMYVGITRAREDLTLTSARGRMNRGEVQYNPVSRFVMEIPDRLLDESPRRKSRSSYEFDDDEDDMPFASVNSFGNVNSYANVNRFANANRFTNANSFADANRPVRVFNASKPYGGSYQTAPQKKDLRPKAVYRKPRTDEAKKPAIAKATTGLAALSKGIPLNSAPDYSVGDRVMHIKYGAGEVLSIEPGPKDYKVKVDFDDFGQKVMYAAFAKLEKL